MKFGPKTTTAINTALPRFNGVLAKPVPTARKLGRFSAMLQRLFVRHDWIYQTTGGVERRTCACCGKSELHDMDDWGSFWLTQYAGNSDKH